MKAIVFGRFGGPDVLHESEVDVPEPGPGQVRLRVRAAGVNPIDGKLRQGLLEAMFLIPLPAISGVEAAGTVDAMGEGVTGLAVGDDVFGWTEIGAYAEYAVGIKLFPKPAGLPWEAAAALPPRARRPSAYSTSSPSTRATRCSSTARAAPSAPSPYSSRSAAAPR